MATYTVTAAPISDTAAHYKAWGTAFGQAMTTFGWVAQTGHGEVTASGTGVSYAWTNVVAAPAAALNAQSMGSYVFRGAWVSGTTYTGSNTAGSNSTDIVTDGGLTYAHITASSNSATAPGADATNWLPYNYEIWKSSGANTTSLPIYIRLVYTGANAGNAHRFHFALGTGVDSNGNLTGAIAVTSTAPITNVVLDNGATSTTSTGAMNFAGDSDNFRFALWRDGPAAGYFQLAVIDRAKTTSGADSDSYFYFGRIFGTSATATTGSCIQLNSTLGGGVISNSFVANGVSGWPGVIYDGANGNTGTLGANFGALQPLPVFPLVGYVANPLLGVMGYPVDLVTNGNINAVWMYAASHNYLVCKPAVTGGYTLNNVATHGTCAAILWE